MSISKGIVVCRSHIVNISNDGVYTMSDGCGVDFIFRYCNAEMATVEGVPVEEMLNRSFYKVFPNGDKKWLLLIFSLSIHIHRAKLQSCPIIFIKIIYRTLNIYPI